MGANGTETDKEFVVDSACIVEQLSYYALDAFGASFVKSFQCVFGWDVLAFSAVDDLAMLVW